MFFNEKVLSNLKENRFFEEQERLRGLSWERNRIYENGLEFISNEYYKVELNLDKQNDIFAKGKIKIIISKDKCELFGHDEDPFFNPKQPTYLDQY